MDKTGSDAEIEQTEAVCSTLFKKMTLLKKELDETKTEYKRLMNKLKSLKEAKTNAENKRKMNDLVRNLESDWIARQFEWSKEIHRLLKEKFKFDSFRSKQLAAINATMSKKDVLLVMPTGGGKSLVYQLPALVEPGFTLVISPLLSLIEDQLMALNRIGINGNTIQSGTPKDEIKEIYNQMNDKTSSLKLLYVTPEWVAKSKIFMKHLKKCYETDRISRVAIDEVHCCSSWGHDFRPDYGFLGLVRKTLAKVPFIGLTATATMSVLTDVQTMLNLEDCMIITAPFNRPNLFYKVLPKPSQQECALKFVEKLLKDDFANQTGIIYTNTINDSINLAKELKSRGLKVAPYHARLESGQKKDIHKKWIQKRYQAIIATVAFGMGIDLPDVRFVLHHSIPRSMESLYQESGRAGRDGLRAECIVLFSLNDYLKVLATVTSLVYERKLLLVLEYCLNSTSCRRALIAKHFEEVWNETDCKKMCDFCKSGSNDYVCYDISSACRDLHKIIEDAVANDQKLTLNKLLDTWFKTSLKKLAVSRQVNINRQQADAIVSFLLLKEYLSIDKGYNLYSTICYIEKGKSPEDAKIEMMSSDKSLGFPIISKKNCEPAAKRIKR